MQGAYAQHVTLYIYTVVRARYDGSLHLLRFELKMTTHRGHQLPVYEIGVQLSNGERAIIDEYKSMTRARYNFEKQLKMPENKVVIRTYSAAE